MKQFLAKIFFTVILTGQVYAGNNMPQPIIVGDLTWISPPGVSGVQIAWVVGSASQAGLYSIRVKMSKGARIPPHSHPDERNTTVLTGTLYAGFGEIFDENKLVAIHAGEVYIAPAGVSHYLYARDGEVVYQESGYGPTATQME